MNFCLYNDHLLRLRDLQFELEQLEACNVWNADRRPTTNAEAETFVNLERAISSLKKEREEIVTSALRGWVGWKSFDELKAESAAGRKRL